MVTLSKIKESIERYGIKAVNNTNIKGVSICFNFLEIPEVDTVLFTVSIMYNGARKNALMPSDFAKLLSSLEKILLEVSDTYQVEGTKYLCTPINDRLNMSWYKLTNCHRLFLIPNNLDIIWYIIGKLSYKLPPNLQSISVTIKANEVNCYTTITGGISNESNQT